MANKTLFELTEGNAPALTDYALTGEDPTNTHVLRRTTWQSLKNLFLANVTTVSNAGWVPVTGTWAYASATTITVPSGAVSIYSVGDKVKLTQSSTVKYFYIIAVADTLLTIAGGADYTLTDATITSPYFSHILTPVEFPDWFNLTAPAWTTTGTAFTNQPANNLAKFSIVGRRVFFTGAMTTNASSGGTGVFIATFTAGQLPPTTNRASGSAYNVSYGTPGYSYNVPNNAIRLAKYDNTAIAGNSEYVTYQLNYMF